MVILMVEVTQGFVIIYLSWLSQGLIFTKHEITRMSSKNKVGIMMCETMAWAEEFF